MSEVHLLPAVLSREIIAKLPPEVSEVAKMDDLTTVAEGESLLAQVTRNFMHESGDTLLP